MSRFAVTSPRPAGRLFSTVITTQGMPDEMVTRLAQALATGIEEVVPRALHKTRQCANNRVECDHGCLEARLRLMRGLRTDRTARPVIAGYAFMRNVRRGHDELGVEAEPRPRVAAAFGEFCDTL